jgi:tRNA-dihydrouridine synthase B
VRIARKHISWYTKGLIGSAVFRHTMNQLQTTDQQVSVVNEFFSNLAGFGRRLTYIKREEIAA